MADPATAVTAPIDLGDRVKLRFRGEDRVRSLNGQVSNDVRRVDGPPPSQSQADKVIVLTESLGEALQQERLPVTGPRGLQEDDPAVFVARRLHQALKLFKGLPIDLRHYVPRFASEYFEARTEGIFNTH